MKGSTMLAMLEQLGVAPSFSRPRVSNDNAYAESLFRTCKYRPDYPSKPFGNLAAAQQWTQKFTRWYNQEHKHSGLKFVTPEQRHGGRDKTILENRDQVYREAKNRNPRRWTRGTRNWKLDAQVWLNPERIRSEALQQAA
jgi:putative transposase